VRGSCCLYVVRLMYLEEVMTTICLVLGVLLEDPCNRGTDVGGFPFGLL